MRYIIRNVHFSLIKSFCQFIIQFNNSYVAKTKFCKNMLHIWKLVISRWVACIHVKNKNREDDFTQTLVRSALNLSAFSRVSSRNIHSCVVFQQAEWQRHPGSAGQGGDTFLLTLVHSVMECREKALSYTEEWHCDKCIHCISHEDS